MLIGDRTGVMYSKTGIDTVEAANWVARHGTLEGYRSGDRISNAELLTLPVDILVPAVLANAGVVTVSHFEWVQNRSGWSWSEATVNERLQEIMSRSFREVLELSRIRRVSLRTAAYMQAIGRVAAVHRMRGLYA